MNFQDSPVFIIASERSGTNLLRKRLTENQNCYLGPAPAHFLKHLYYQQPYYGDLSRDDNFKSFVTQAIDLCLVHFSPWRIDWTVDDVMQGFDGKRRDSIHLMHYMMNRYAREQGFSGYICKDNFLYEFAMDIAAEFPNAKFIYLYRDPRDFVLSQIKRPAAVRSITRYAKLWAYEQVKSIAVSERLGAQGRCYWLSYERLIENEEYEIFSILDYLGVPKTSGRNYEDNMRENVHEWSNLSKETKIDNSRKFLKELSRRKINTVEKVCYLQMKYLGYESICDAKRSPSRSFLLLCVVFGALAQKASATIKRLGSASVLTQRSKVLEKVKVNYRSDLF